jgi:glycosyltransferase involved in cell wall biosynthesis
MHILLIHQAFAAVNEPGGTRHHEIALHLAEKGHQVTVIASPISYLTGKANKQRISWVQRQDGGMGIAILRAYTYRALHKSFVHRIFSFLSFMFSSFIIGLRVKDVDLIWGTSPPIFQGITAWMLARLKGVPFLFEIRDLWPAFAVAVGVLRNPILIRASEWLEGFLYRKADQLMVNSPGFINHIEMHGGRNIALIPNGADMHMFNPKAAGIAIREKFGWGDKFVVLYAGAHGLSNDLGVLLEAASILGQHKDIAIVLLGDGKDKPLLQGQAEEMNLENVHFLPPVPKQEMADFLAMTDACIAILKPIELYKTVYPNKVFDYMAAGRPILLAIDGVIREVVEDARAGLFIQPGNPRALVDALLYLKQDPKKAQEMGMAGRAYLEEHFSRTKLADEFETLIRSVQNIRNPVSMDAN